MQSAEMSLLFTTRFSESCFQAIPAVAQWMDDVTSSLTIAHVYNPRNTSVYSAEEQLLSFFAEADRYPNTRRVLLEGDDPGEAISTYLNDHRHDMIICPSSDRVGLPRPFHRSTRARLLASTPATLWTMGDAMDFRRFGRPARVGCIISRRSDSYRPLELACDYALRVGATLQLMCVVPQVDEGTLRNAMIFNEPLAESVATEELQRIAAALPLSPELYVAMGSDARSLIRVLDNARTDILFTGKQQAIRSTLWTYEMERYVDDAGCPVVCVDHDRSLPKWRLRLPADVSRNSRLLAIA